MKRHPLNTLSIWATPATNREHGIPRRRFRLRAEQQRAQQRAMQVYVDRMEADLERLAQRFEGEAEPEEKRVVVQ